MTLASFVTIGFASIIDSQKISSFTPQIVCSSFTGNGTLFAGDSNFTLYRSDNNGTSFRQVYKFPNQTSIGTGFTGYVMMLFVDSKNDVFVSIPGTNRLYRSDNFCANFTESLRANGTVNDGFYVAMSEDKAGNLYTTTYCNSETTYPQTYKSGDNGKTWVTIASCSVVHMHNVKVNPSNGYLYIVCGEFAQGNSHGNNDAERIFRSTDGGKTWILMVERNATNQKIYATMTYNGSWVYIGSDVANATNFIDRFYDDGLVGKCANGTGSPVNVERVYTEPVSDGILPFVSAVWFNNAIVFSNTVEFNSGTALILSSNNGLNWTTIKTVTYVPAQHHCNMLTSNPTSVMIGSDGPSANFALVLKPDQVPSPTPTPVTPTTSTTPSYTYTTTTPSPAATPKPTAQPTEEPTPAPTATPTQTPASPTAKPTESVFTFDIMTLAIIVFAVIGIISALALTVREKRLTKKPKN